VYCVCLHLNGGVFCVYLVGWGRVLFVCVRAFMCMLGHTQEMHTSVDSICMQGDGHTHGSVHMRVSKQARRLSHTHIHKG